MTKSLHTGRGIKKALYEKRARRLKGEYNDLDIGVIIGQREVGLIFTPIPAGSEDLFPFIQEILSVRNFRQDFTFRKWSDGKTVRYSKAEIREQFYRSLKRYDIVLKQNEYNGLSDKAKSLLEKETFYYRETWNSSVWGKASYTLPKKYYTWAESPLMQNVHTRRPMLKDGVRLHTKLWKEGENHHLDTHHKRDDWYLRPYKREKTAVINAYQEYLDELNEESDWKN